MKEVRKKAFYFGIIKGVAFIFILSFIACQKAEDRTCFKSTGSYSEIIMPLDSIRHFDFGERIKYRIYQNNYNKVIIKGGKNLIQQIDISNRDNILYVRNRNKCQVLRNDLDIVTVEIHYPFLNSFFMNASDSVVFMDKIKGYSFSVEMRNGGGSLVADVDVHKISMIVSSGAGDFTLGGKADEAELKVQNNGSANAIYFRSEYVYIYQNSTANMFIDLKNSSALISIDGTGNVFYSNDAGNIEREGLGEGQIIKL